MAARDEGRSRGLGATGATGSAVPGATGTRGPGSTGATGPVVSQVGTSDQASQAARDPIVIGAVERPIEPGGPGAGAAQLARETSVFEGRSLAVDAGQALGARPLSEAERIELENFRTKQAAGQGIVVDAALVKGVRLARAATAVKRDGVLYGPGTSRQWVPVDFAAYTELVSIGAISDTRWDRLEEAD